MKTKKVIHHIVNWLAEYAKQANANGFVVGISGGIDSALTSTLIAKTNLPLICIEMPIHQQAIQIERGKNHIKWLRKQFNNVSALEFNLTEVFDTFVSQLPKKKSMLALANTRARLRMSTLYYFAQLNNSLVVGTGNKVEDFGIGFFTKYGDGGVDISPIADLFKTEVYELANELKINKEICNAPPTDGLWNGNKTDEEQIGATYVELEWAMQYRQHDTEKLTPRQRKVLNIYKKRNLKNLHKTLPIPVCNIPKNLK